MPERYEVPPERLARWLTRWVQEHDGIADRQVGSDEFRLVGGDGAVLDVRPPFGVPAELTPEALVTDALRERVVGVLLVRLGGHAAAVFRGTRLEGSKVGSRYVHGRNRAGGQSQRRFERRRGEQARLAHEAAADVAARVLLPRAGDLEWLVSGGDRGAVDTVLEDPRLAPVAAVPRARFLGNLPDPRFAVLLATPARFRATVLRPG